MNQKNYSIFKALKQYPNISVEDCELKFLENAIHQFQTTLVKKSGEVIFEIHKLPKRILVKKGFEQKSFKEEAEAYVYIEKKCSVVDLTQAPTYLQKIHTEEVLKSLENELKQNKF
jgi:hypothetical protein